MYKLFFNTMIIISLVLMYDSLSWLRTLSSSLKVSQDRLAPCLIDSTSTQPIAEPYFIPPSAFAVQTLYSSPH